MSVSSIAMTVTFHVTSEGLNVIALACWNLHLRKSMLETSMESNVRHCLAFALGRHGEVCRSREGKVVRLAKATRVDGQTTPIK